MSDNQITVPLVMPEHMRAMLQTVASVRSAQGVREGNRRYSMSALVREVLRQNMDSWAKEIQAARLAVPAPVEASKSKAKVQ